MRYNCYIDIGTEATPLGTGIWTAFTPDSVGAFSNNVEEGFYFKRIGWGEMQISNRPPASMYDTITALNYNIRINVRYATKSDSFAVEGYFGKNDCEFDYDRKIITVTPTTLDKYTPILENWEKDIDFNEYNPIPNPITVTIPNLNINPLKDWDNAKQWISGVFTYRKGSVEKCKNDNWVDDGRFDIYFNAGGDPNMVAFGGSWYRYEMEDLEYSNLQERRDVLNSDEYGDYVLTSVTIWNEGTWSNWFNTYRRIACTTVFKREELEVVDTFVDDPPNYDSPGTGYTMREPIVGGVGGQAAHLWTRPPFNLSDAQLLDKWVLENEVVTGTETGYRTSSIDFGGDDSDTYSRTIDSPIALKDLIKYYYNRTAIALSGDVISTFLFNDNEEKLHSLDGTTGKNYVTGEDNYLNDVYAFFTNDIKYRIAGAPNILPKYSLKQILKDLWILFKVYWDITEDFDLRLEHIKYVDLTITTEDIRSDDLLDFTLNWKFDKSKMFNRIDVDTVISYNEDFGNNFMEFDSIVSNNRNKDLKLTQKTDAISTDVAGAIVDSNNVDYGIMLIHVVDSEVESRRGLLSGTDEVNGYLALSNLLIDFYTYEGIWDIGYINDREYQFRTLARSLVGGEITLKGKSDYMFYVTDLGIGMLESSTLDFENEVTKLTLRYRYGSTPIGDTFTLMTQHATDFDGADDIEYDFGETGIDYFIPMSIIDRYWLGISYNETYKTFSILTAFDNAWTVVASDAWIGFTGSNTGTGNGTVGVYVTDNLSGASRYGTLTVTSAATTKIVNISQAATQVPAFVKISYMRVNLPDYPIWKDAIQYAFIYLKNIGLDITTNNITIAWYNPSNVLLKPIETIVLTINSGEIVFLNPNCTPVINGVHTLVVNTEDVEEEYEFTVTTLI